MSLYYQDEHVTLFHGDCLGIDAWLAADVLVTDPPYGVNYRSGWSNEFRGVGIANDETTDARDKCIEKWGSEKPALVFGSWKCLRPAATQMVLIWDKGTVGMGNLSLPWFPATEEIYVLGNGYTGTRTSPVLRHHGRNTYHPTEKPVALLHSLLRKTFGVVADPFVGSGSTLIAARNLGRKAIGVELDEKYCEIIARRLDQMCLDFGEGA
jgi:DNA modification methylase